MQEHGPDDLGVIDASGTFWVNFAHRRTDLDSGHTCQAKSLHVSMISVY